jgi:hypothetical protein
MNFITCLNRVENLIKRKEYDKAWGEANSSLLNLKKAGDEMWFAMYHQLAVISAKEKRWSDALYQTACVIYYLGGFGGKTREKLVINWLKKIKREDKLDEFMEISLKNEPTKSRPILYMLFNDKQ